MHQYREGKVKSTPTRGVKQFLKPDAYKQSEVQWSVISDQNRWRRRRRLVDEARALLQQF